MRTIHMTALLSLVLLFGLALGTGGCTSGTGGVSTQATLGPAGGTLALEGQGVQLTVPAGALTAEAQVFLGATASRTGMRVTIQPDQLVLARAATLSVQFQGAAHIVRVDEIGSGSQWPLGVLSRVEKPTGAQVQVRLDHFSQLEVDVDDGASDGGSPTGCSRQGGEVDRDADGGWHWHGDGWDGGMVGHGEGEHHDADGGREDGGFDDDFTGGDAGTEIFLACPAGFECDDGVCVAPGGNDEENSCDADAGVPNVCPTASHCEDHRCLPGVDDGGVHPGGHD